MARGGVRGGGRGVSTVLGVVLVVAIVVVLAGTVSYYALGYGDEVRSPAPQFGVEHAYNDTTTGHGEYLNLTHKSGDIPKTRNITLRVTEAVVRDDASDALVDRAELTERYALRDQVGDGFASGEVFSIDATMFEHAGGGAVGPNEYVDLSEAVVRLVWVPPEEDRSDTVYEWRGPDA